MNDDVPIWAKGIFWLCGLCNALLGAMGGYSLFSSVYWVHMRYRSHPLAPYFWAAFAVMELINVPFLSTFLLAPFQFFPVEAIRRVDALRRVGGPSWLRDSEWHALAHTGVDRNEHCSRKWSWEYGDSPLLLWSGVPALYTVASTIVLQCAATDAMEVSAPTEMVVTRTCGR